MKPNIFTCLGICVLIFTSFNAQAKAYFGLRGELSTVKEKEIWKETDDLPGGSAFLGVSSGPMRMELEYSYIGHAKFTQTGLDKLESRFQRGLVNGFINLPIRGLSVSPFLTAGAGTVYHSLKYAGEKEDGFEFAWTVGAGLSIDLTRNVAVDFGYRYVDMGDGEIAGKSVKFKSNETFAGVRFAF